MTRQSSSLRRFQGRPEKQDSTQNISDSLAFPANLEMLKTLPLKQIHAVDGGGDIGGVGDVITKW